MTVNGVGNATDCKRSDSIGGNMQMDSISRNLKNQIANAQKKLQELSSNQELSFEDNKCTGLIAVFYGIDINISSPSQQYISSKS